MVWEGSCRELRDWKPYLEGGIDISPFLPKMPGEILNSEKASEFKGTIYSNFYEAVERGSSKQPGWGWTG